MKQIKLNISLTRAIALCACIAAIFTAVGVLIGRAFAQSAGEPCAAVTEANENSKAQASELKTASQPEYAFNREQAPALRIEETYNYTQFTATAYCKCRKCNGRWGANEPDGAAMSATGARLTEGISIAADFSVLRPYTQVEISGMGVYTVHDCGGAVNGSRIDIYFENHEDAESFGVQTVWLRILEEK